MNLHQRLLTQNDCYKAGEHIKVEGLMIHSTGVNNPNLSRYVDAPELGKISSGHWNQPKPGGREVCVHGFIGKDGNGGIAAYQTLPWDMRGWHAGGSANNNHIGVEICEDNLEDAEYFAAVYKEAVELFVYLCKKFGLTEKNVTTHCEGYQHGIASNHADVMHWFPKHGKSIDTFRADIKKGLAVKAPEAPKPVSKPAAKSIDELAKDVIAGKLGNGADRKRALGSQYDEVQKRVAELLAKPKAAPAPKPVEKTIDQLAKEVIDGKLGYGDTRKKALGSRYDEVQKRVNEILGAQYHEKTVSELADEVIKGLHGSGKERQISLGNMYDEVQAEINRRFS